VQLLADELLRSKGGRPLAVRHLEDAAGGPGQQAVQAQVLEFIRVVAAATASPLLSSPQLADFYVHHHFLQFARLYHAALSTAAASAALPGNSTAPSGTIVIASSSCSGSALRACRSHLNVLFEMAARSSGGGGVRRRFLQLHVLDFLLRELSLEHSVRHQALISSRTPSTTTPASTARQLSSRPSARAAGAGAEAAAGGWSAGAPGSAVNELIGRFEDPSSAAIGGGVGSGRSRLGGSAAAVVACPPQPSEPPAGSRARHTSPLRGRRLVATASAISSGASAAKALALPAWQEGSSPHKPRPPEGPKPECVSPQRKRPPVVPVLSVPSRPVQQQQEQQEQQVVLAPAPSALSIPPFPQQQHQQIDPPDPKARTISSPPRTPTAAAQPINDGDDDDDDDNSIRSGSGGSASPRWSAATPEPPEPTGDLSEDFAAIEEWEERTGRRYEFRGLSDAEDEVQGGATTDADGSSSRSSSPAGTARVTPAAAEGAGGAPASALRHPCCIPRLELGAGAPPGARMHLQTGGWAALAAAADEAAAAALATSPGGGDEGGDLGRRSGGSSYRPGYDLEEDFARGYVPAGLESDRSSESGGSGLIPAGRGGEGGAFEGDKEWGSSTSGGGSSGGSEVGDGEEAAVTPAAVAAAAAAAAPAVLTGQRLVPALNLSAKLLLDSPAAKTRLQQQQVGEATPTQQEHQIATSLLRVQAAAAAALATPAAAATSQPTDQLPAAGGALINPVLASYRSRRQVNAFVGCCVAAACFGLLQAIEPHPPNPSAQPHPRNPSARRPMRSTTTTPCTSSSCAWWPPSCSPQRACWTLWPSQRTPPTRSCSSMCWCYRTTCRMPTTPPRWRGC